MRRLVSSDWQLADNARDRYRLDWCKSDLLKLVDKYQPDQLLCLGDITEHKDEHPASLVYEIVDLFHKLANKCEVIILQGNHDFLHKGHPFFQFLQLTNNIRWIAAPTVIDNCLYLPHTRDYKKDWAQVDLKGSYNFIFAHNIFTGATGNGQKLSGFPTNIFSRDSVVISGDVHEPQAFDNIIYVGSPCLCDFGDDYVPRVLLLDGLDIKSIKVKGPQKRVINCAVNRSNGKRELAFDHNANVGDIVKIKADLMMEDIPAWDEIKQEIHDWCVKQQFIVNTIQPIVAVTIGERSRAIISKKKTDNQYFENFIQRTGIDEQTANVGKSIIELI